MKYLKKYNESQSYSKLCVLYGVKEFTQNLDGSIDVEGDVILYKRELEKLPVKYNRVGGDFYCSINKLVSLKNSPKSVGGSFYCSSNKLVSLEGSPELVGGDFDCSNNQLTSLEGSPKHIGGDFFCDNNKIFEFEHFPKHISGNFYCKYNPIYEIWKLFGDMSNIELLNDLDPFRLKDGQPVVVLDRINYFLELIGKEKVEKIEQYITI